MNKPVNTADTPTPGLDELLRISFEQLGYQQLNNIDCEVEDNVLVLTGKLKSFYLKQVAQTVAMKIPGVALVRNLIEVQ